MTRSENKIKAVTLQKLEKHLAKFKAYRNYSLFGTFSYNADKKVIEVNLVALKSQKLIDSATSIKRKQNKRVSPNVGESLRLKRDY